MKPPSNGTCRTRPGGWLTPVAVFALLWFAFLCSGYDLGQLVHGSRILVSQTPGNGDVGRTLAHSGLAVLTVVPVRIAGLAGILGCVGLMLRRRHAFIALGLAALLLVWPVLVWGTALVFWRALDRGGSLLLAIHLVVTVAVAYGFPILAMLLARRGRITSERP